MSGSQSTEQEQTFYFIRHALTEMNEFLYQVEWGSPGFYDKGLWDTHLSPAGIAQAVNVHHQWRTQYDANLNSSAALVIPWDKVELVLSSPLLRALQTYSYLIEHTPPPLIPSHVPKIVHPLLRERLYLSADVGSPRSVIKASYPAFDCSALPEDDSAWWYTEEKTSTAASSKIPDWRPAGDYLCPGEPDDVFASRLTELRAYLVSRRERHVVVMTHWGILRELVGCEFLNCEMRTVRASELLTIPSLGT